MLSHCYFNLDILVITVIEGPLTCLLSNHIASSKSELFQCFIHLDYVFYFKHKFVNSLIFYLVHVLQALPLHF